MRYILITTQVYTGNHAGSTSTTECNRLGLFVLGREGWLPWPAVEGQTNCTDPSLCPILSFPTRGEALIKVTAEGMGVVVPVDTNHPVAEALYEVGPSAVGQEGRTVVRVPDVYV